MTHASDGDGTRVVRAGQPEPVAGQPFLPGPVFAAPFHLGPGERYYARYENPTLVAFEEALSTFCLLYTSPSPRDRTRSRMPSSA